MPLPRTRSDHKNKGHKRHIKPWLNLDARYLRNIKLDGKLGRRVARGVVHRGQSRVEMKLEEMRMARLIEAKKNGAHRKPHPTLEQRSANASR